MTQPISLVLLPGLGADARLLEPQRAAFPDLVTPRWIAPQRRELLAEYAGRMAETLPAGRPMVLGGVSLGGMVAFEMARRLQPQAVVLIASCRSRGALRPAVRPFRPFVPLAPLGLAKLLAPAGVRLLGRLSPSLRRLCVRMFREADSRFMRWALRAILDWDPSPLDGIPVYHIHGARDRIIPTTRVEADELIPGGGHLINITHVEEVNAFLQRVVAGTCTS
jgi:pimeloyl-ACP methyl ester carboxylesterase